MDTTWFDGLGIREYTAQRVEALWRDSPEARRRVAEVLTDLAITDPRRVAKDQRTALCYALLDIEGNYPDAERSALANAARMAGHRIRAGGGTRTDAGRLASTWLPDFRDEVMAGFGGGVAADDDQAMA